MSIPDARPGAGRGGWLRRLCLVAIAALYVASVPWYRSPDATPATWLGLPDWVTVAVLCYVGVALANGVAWLLTDFEDDPPGATPPTDPISEAERAERGA